MAIPMLVENPALEEVVGALTAMFILGYLVVPAWWRRLGIVSRRMVGIYYLAVAVSGTGVIDVVMRHPHWRHGLLKTSLLGLGAVSASFFATLGLVVMFNQFAWFVGKAELAESITRGVVRREGEARIRGWLWESLLAWRVFAGSAVVCLAIGVAIWLRHPVARHGEGAVIGGVILWLAGVALPAALAEALRVMAPKSWWRDGSRWRKWPRPGEVAWLLVGSMTISFVLLAFALQQPVLLFHALAAVVTLFVIRPQRPTGNAEPPEDVGSDEGGAERTAHGEECK